jgi:hypothetical protein
VTGRTSNWAPPAAVCLGGGPDCRTSRLRYNPRRLYEWIDALPRRTTAGLFLEHDVWPRGLFCARPRPTVTNMQPNRGWPFDRMAPTIGRSRGRPQCAAAGRQRRPQSVECRAGAGTRGCARPGSPITPAASRIPSKRPLWRWLASHQGAPPKPPHRQRISQDERSQDVDCHLPYSKR